MGQVMTFPADRHQEVQLLLPWHSTGKLDEAEQALVEAHLAECELCRADVGAEPALRAALDLASPVTSGWAALEARVRRASPEPRRTARPWLAAGRRLMRPERLKWVVAAQFAALVVLGVAALPDSPPAARDGPYRVLGDAAAARSGNVLAMFRPEASEAALRHSLQASGARLVDGPTAAGAYLLDVPGGENGRPLAALRHDPSVTMAEPIAQAPPE
jgi:hypothetical protein